MSLRYPFLLLLAIPLVPWFVLALRKPGGLRASPLGRLAAVGKGARTLLWWLPEALAFAFALVCVLLIAGPQRDLDPGKDEGRGLSIAIALDRSSSMSAQIPYEGGRISRLEGVKLLTADFLKKRERDAFALLSFARYPETHTPLTTNREVLLDFLKLIDVPRSQEEDGTAIGDAITLAVARLQDLPEGQKGIVILLTDGRNNQGEKSPDEGAALAAKAGVTVYTIALGGQGVIIQDGRMLGMPVDVDDEGLASIAKATGGRYYRADKLADLGSFYEDIAKRETGRIDRDKPRETELVLGPGIAALCLLIALSVLARHPFLRRGDL
jgi:Ca-activated chloride channel homolog